MVVVLPHGGQPVRTARAPLAEVLRGLGGEVTMRLYPGMGHPVDEHEIAEVRAMLQSALAAVPA